VVLGLFSIPVGNKETNEAALIAAIKALELSSYRLDFVGRYFVIEPDSADVVQWMTKPLVRSGRFNDLFILDFYLAWVQ